jgi:hypothetical protein
MPLAQAAVVASASIDATMLPRFAFMVGCPDWIDGDPSMIDD